MRVMHPIVPRIGIVVPCFNEEEVLPETGRRLSALLGAMMTDGRVAAGSQVVFVDDGSRDHTWEMIEGMASSDTRFAGESKYPLRNMIALALDAVTSFPVAPGVGHCRGIHVEFRGE